MGIDSLLTFRPGITHSLVRDFFTFFSLGPPLWVLGPIQSKKEINSTAGPTLDHVDRARQDLKLCLSG